MVNPSVYMLPAPVKGWNTKDPVFAMDPQYALQMVNAVPEPGLVRNVGGGQSFVNYVGTDPIKTLMVLTLANGTEKFIAAAGGKLYDITSGSPSDISGVLPPTNSVLQHTVFRNRLIVVNGVDGFHEYTGTGTFAISGFNWIIFGTDVPTNISSYKNRVYFVTIGGKIWYGGVDAIAGAVSQFDPSSLWVQGGKAVYAGSTTKQMGANSSNQFVIISDKGEVLVYEGDYPGSTTWQMVGHYIIPPPVNYRSFCHIGSDLHILTIRGVLPMSEVLGQQAMMGQYIMLSDKIEPTFLANTALAPFNNTPAAALVWHPNGPWLVCHLGAGECYCMHGITKGWFRLAVGLSNTYTIASFAGRLHISSIGGDDHTVRQLVYQTDVNPGSIANQYLDTTFTVQHAYNYMGDFVHLKNLKMAQPIIGGDYTASSSSAISLALTPTFDYGSGSGTSTGTLRLGSATENVNHQWFGLNGMGRAMSLTYSATLTGNARLKIYASNVTYQQGGIL